MQLNVSLDTLNPDTYTKITGASELSRVLEGIRTMEALHIPLKINVVLRRMSMLESGRILFYLQKIILWMFVLSS